MALIQNLFPWNLFFVVAAAQILPQHTLVCFSFVVARLPPDVFVNCPDSSRSILHRLNVRRGLDNGPAGVFQSAANRSVIMPIPVLVNFRKVPKIKTALRGNMLGESCIPAILSIGEV